MKKYLVAFFISVIGICLLAYIAIAVSAGKTGTKFEYYPFNIRVPSLLKTPSPNSDSAFVFPIEVSLTGVSKDKKWFRFRVSYDLVFFGKYDFEGWCNVDPWGPFNRGATPEVMYLK